MANQELLERQWRPVTFTRSGHVSKPPSEGGEAMSYQLEDLSIANIQRDQLHIFTL